MSCLIFYHDKLDFIGIVRRVVAENQRIYRKFDYICKREKETVKLLLLRRDPDCLFTSRIVFRYDDIRTVQLVAGEVAPCGVFTLWT
jgi:hypothetical protein